MRKNELGSAHIVVVGVLVVALIGALGFIFWQNIIQKKDDTQTSATTSVKSNDEKSTDDTKKTEEDPNEGYVVLKDWGVRFKNTNSIAVSWSKDSVNSYNQKNDNTYYFTTTAWKNLAGACNTEIPFVRSKDKIVSMTSPPKSLNEDKISGYYYYYYSPQDACGDDTTDTAEWSRQAKSVMSFLESVQAAR